MKHLQAIKAKLKTQHPGLPEAILDRVARTLAKTAKDDATDEDLTQAVANQQDMVTSLAEYSQQEGDRRATEATKKAEDKAKAEAGKTPPATPPASGADNPAPAQDNAVLELLQKMSDRLDSYEKKEAAKTHTQTLEGLLKDKVPASYYALAIKGREFKDADEVNAFATDIEAQYTAFATEQGIKTLSGQSVPGKGTPTGIGSTEVSADLKAYMAKNAPAAAAK